jgi:hypothetical protein
MIHKEDAFLDEDPSILYFPTGEGNSNPELLLFEEKLIAHPPKAKLSHTKLRHRLKDIYDQYTVDFFATDKFVRKLQSFKKIRVLLTMPIEPAEVRERLRRIVRDRSYHHLRWLIIDSLLLPFAILAMPIPGPNFVGYYLLFRIFSHWKSYRSASRAKLDDVDVLVSNHAKEVSVLFGKTKDIRDALRELRSKYGLRALQEHQFIPQKSKLISLMQHWKQRLHQTS